MDDIGKGYTSELVTGTQDNPIIIASGDTQRLNSQDTAGTSGQAMKTSTQETEQISGWSTEAPSITVGDTLINTHSQNSAGASGQEMAISTQRSVPPEARVIPGSHTSESNSKKRPRITDQAIEILMPKEHEQLIHPSKKIKQAHVEKSPKKVKSRTQDQRTEDEVLAINNKLEEERKKIFQTIHAQFAACRQSPPDTSHKSRLATFEVRRDFTVPPIYVPMCTKENEVLTYCYWRWEQCEKRNWRFTGRLTEDQMPKNIRHSLHFKRIKDIVANNPFIYAKYINPEVEGEWIYYSIMILPGANREFADQGYVGKTTQTVARRWGDHCSFANRTPSLLVDRNFRLFLQYYDGQPNKIVQENFAIFALGCVVNLRSYSVQLGIEQPILNVIESHLIHSQFCSQHGRPPQYCAAHGRICAVHGPTCLPECNVETQCSSNSECTKHLLCDPANKVPACSYVTLSDMRFGMNNPVDQNTSYQKLMQGCRAIDPQSTSLYRSLLTHKRTLQSEVHCDQLPQILEDQTRTVQLDLDRLNRSSAYKVH